MGLNAAEGIGNAVGNMFGGPSRPDANENINYACVADLQITELGKTAGILPLSQPGMPPPPGVYQTRLAASVHQKKLDEQETQIEKLQGEILTLQQKQQAQQKELEDYLAGLNVG